MKYLGLFLIGVLTGFGVLDGAEAQAKQRASRSPSALYSSPDLTNPASQSPAWYSRPDSLVDSKKSQAQPWRLYQSYSRDDRSQAGEVGIVTGWSGWSLSAPPARAEEEKDAQRDRLSLSQ